ncbi:hypothetical protein PP175_29495 (plasmid) [Aneurinibacillus sp. Ricciae_BoGa-3]|uniref:hypothetical protein n=1 Tax=Aneurinibacillus sp. Ricciae_BoGa-3 TaxID=3022697 RepID=UPI0023403525|nr:hypothetical protein [Aneurinibacillus sp. Ricciae_BoGa-3]WCK57327.1 hypothetical protein PP175_29495 [Aneurinibacillus sp. Ricciae_BoGa-3]
MSYEQYKSIAEVLFFIFLVCIPFYLISVYTYNKKFVAKRIISNEQNMREWEKEWKRQRMTLFAKSQIPQAYWDVSVLNVFEAYLVNRRADTLKECINMFEEEQRYSEHMRQLSIIAQQQAEINSRLQNIEFLAWID